MQLTRPRTFDQVEAPIPVRNGPHEVLLRTVTGAICGSDLPYFNGSVSPLFDDTARYAPNLPGYPLHEVVGEVLESDDADLPVGSYAVGWATSTNALAELVVTEAASLMRVPSDIPLDDAVILQPLACVVDTLERMGDLAGRHVAVVGLGPFGLLFAHVAKAMGAAVVTGIDPIDRTDLATTFGIDAFEHSTSDRWAMSVTSRPDVVIEAVGHQVETIADIAEAAAEGARIFCFGVPDEPFYPVPMQRLFRKALHLSAGTVLERRDSLEQAVTHLRSHPFLLTSYLTHTFAAKDATEAFELAARGRPGQVKIRLTLGDHDGS